MDRRREDHSAVGGSGAILQTASRGPSLGACEQPSGAAAGRRSRASPCWTVCLHLPFVGTIWWTLSLLPVALWAEEFVARLLYSTFWGIFRGSWRAWKVFQLQTVPQLGSPGTTGPFFTLKTSLKVLWTRTDLLRLWFWRSDDQGLFPVLLTCSRGSLHPSEAWQPLKLHMSLTVSSGHVTQLCCPRAARRPFPSRGMSWSFSEASEFNHLL